MYITHTHVFKKYYLCQWYQLSIILTNKYTMHHCHRNTLLGAVLPYLDPGRAGGDPRLEHRGTARGLLLHRERHHRREVKEVAAHDRPSRYVILYETVVCEWV